MSKKPMYLKRRADSKIALLILFILFMFAAWYFLPRKEVVQSEPELPQFEISESVFQGRVEEIIAPKSGIKAYYMFQEGGLTAMSFNFVQTGFAYEDKGYEGIANIAAQTIKEGAGRWSAKELRNLLGNSGIKISFAVDQDDFSGQITFPNAQRADAVKYLREMLLNPHFEDKYVENAKANTIRAIEAQKENPSSELALAFNQAVFGDFAYARNILGEVDTVTHLNRRSLANFVRKNLGKNKLFVGVVSNLNREEAAEMIDAVFAKLPDVEIKNIGEADINWQTPDINLNRNIPQDIALYAAQGTCRTCEDFYPLYIANYILGGAGLNSRLNQTLREQENLTYGISSWLDLNDKANLIKISFAATDENMSKARQLFDELWQKAGREGFTQEELNSAKNHLVASHNLRFASTIGISDMLVYMQRYNLGIDFLQKRNQLVKSVTLQQLNQAAQKYFNHNLLRAEIGNLKK
ncbi:MAG: insulinase family protein [Alphaproteobacteria bacterium]|nr:insulinase family protein [Alphaproteobacteria bacterium]